MEAHLKQLRTEIHAAYHRMYEILLAKLREEGFTPNDNPLNTEKPEELNVGWLKYREVKIQYKGIPISIVMQDDLKMEARCSLWEKLTARQEQNVSRWHGTDWLNGTYSRYKHVPRCTYSNDLKDLITKVKFKIDKAEKVKALREKEVAEGKGIRQSY